jgi:hypothetical protein
VYIAVSALVPIMLRAHERARVLTPLALLAGVVAIDVVRISTGIDGIGFVNLLLVWLLVQQLGFHLADGSVDRLSRRMLWGIAAAAIGFLAVLTVVGPYDVDMFENLNPPSACLVVLGVAQLALFQLARPRIRAWVERADASRLISALGERAMTVYLWHMPVLIALAGLSLVANTTFGLPLPEPLSFEWWTTRPVWLGVAALAVVPVVLAFARFERGRSGRSGGAGRMTAPVASVTGASRARIATTSIDAMCGVAGIALLLVAGFGPVPGVVALALLSVSLLGSGRLSARIRFGTPALSRTSQFVSALA